MDALSDVLRVAHLTGGVFLHADFFAPWCMAARVAPEHCAPALGPASHLILYHYVVEGELRIRVDGEDGEGLVLAAGDVVLLPRNDLHLVGSDLTLPPVAGSDIIQPPKDAGLFSIHHGGSGRRTRMICGFLGCDCAEDNPVIATLPSLLKLNVEQGGAAEWIRSTFQYAAEEVAAGRPGSETVLAKLSELLFVEAVRRYAEALPPGQTGWLAGLRDPHVARALALLHDCSSQGPLAPPNDATTLPPAPRILLMVVWSTPPVSGRKPSHSGVHVVLDVDRTNAIVNHLMPVADMIVRGSGRLPQPK